MEVLLKLVEGNLVKKCEKGYEILRGTVLSNFPRDLRNPDVMTQLDCVLAS